MIVTPHRPILLVEDEAIIAIAEAATLRRFGYTVRVAHSGEEAVRLALGEEQFDMILMDIDLGPGLSGPDAASRILAVKHLPIVFLTSHQEEETVEMVRGITRYGYVIKDSGDFVLKSSIEMAFELFQARGRPTADPDGEGKRILSHLTDDHPDPVLRVGSDGTVQYANRASDPLLEAWGCGRGERVPPEWQEAVEAAFLRRASTRRDLRYGDRYYSVLVVPVKEGTWVSIYGRDVTEVKRTGAVIERRIHALTQPRENGDVVFEDLFNRAEIQRIQDEFSDATGVASLITYPDGTPITEPSNFTMLCNDIIRKTDRGCANCFRSDAAIGRYHPEGPVVQPCLSGGLWDAGASITVGDRHVASWLIGQVRDETQDEGSMRAYAREIGADEEEFIRAFYRVPAMSRMQFEKIATVLFTFAGQLSNAAYQNLLQARAITERDRAQEKIGSLLAEKELLLKEVHHRIKNNMNTVMSLLSLQARSMSDPVPAAALGEARRRVHSMMLLYEKLYRSEGFRDLPVSSYLRPLIRDIVASFPNRDGVAIETDIQDFSMDARQLSAVGLIVNELLSNVMKYAFVGRDKGTIRITANTQGQRATIIVRDDGVGVSPDLDLHDSPGFGLKLVDMLTQQLGGALRMERGNGTAFILECSTG